jgi:hypothetical protein
MCCQHVAPTAQYDLGFFEHEPGGITRAENPFDAKVTYVPGINRYRCAR